VTCSDIAWHRPCGVCAGRGRAAAQKAMGMAFGYDGQRALLALASTTSDGEVANAFNERSLGEVKRATSSFAVRFEWPLLALVQTGG
jgi:hypothetical protein